LSITDVQADLPLMPALQAPGSSAVPFIGTADRPGTIDTGKVVDLDFAVVWQPGPNGVPTRTALAYAVAAAPLLAGLAIQWERAAGPGALVLTALYSLGVILLDVPRVIAHPSVFVTWYGVAEPLALVAGGLVAYAYGAQLEPAIAGRLSKIGRLIFGVCLIVFGLAHVFYLAYTAKLVPAWLPPGQTFWGICYCGGAFCGRHRNSFRYLRAHGRQVADGNVRRIRHPGACSHDLHRPPHSHQLGGERDQLRLDRICVGDRGLGAGRKIQGLTRDART
jgi:hypothetical protein